MKSIKNKAIDFKNYSVYNIYKGILLGKLKDDSRKICNIQKDKK